MEGRYEFVGGNSFKQWTLEKVDDNDYETNWGKIGKAPQGFKTGITYEEAVKLVASKLKKGYEKV
jgi:predicted DNA-binding WGR domain protein